MPHDSITEPASSDTLDCRATVRRLWDYLDGRLTGVDVEAVDAHLAHCDECPPHFVFERAFLRAVREARAEHATADALRTRVTSALAREGFVAR